MGSVNDCHFSSFLDKEVLSFVSTSFFQISKAATPWLNLPFSPFTVTCG